jgi:tripartite-type tricarboxylate transporter receptor subunit TctC
MQRRDFLICSASWAAMSAAGNCLAQTWPERPIKVIQGFAPGGNADTIARFVSAEMAKGLNQTMVVESVSGAGGTIASATVSRAKPDGHILLLATGGHAVAGALYSNPGYRTVQDFEMVGTITFFPFLVVTTADSKVSGLATLLGQARANPGKVAYGTAGVGSTHHLAGELLASMSKTDLLHVPYRGDSASLTALLSGDIPMIIAPPTAVMPNIKQGRLRALAVTGPTRWPGLPDVPTVAEQGVSGYDVRSWAGMMAPAGTPRPIIERLNVELLKALQVPAVRSRLEDMGGEVRGSTPEEMRVLVSTEVQRWTQVVAEAKIPRQ